MRKVRLLLLAIFIATSYGGYVSVSTWLSDVDTVGADKNTQIAVVKGVVQGVTDEKNEGNNTSKKTNGSVLAVQDEVTDNSLVFRLPVYFFDLIHAVSGKFDTLLDVGTDLTVGSDATIGNDITVNGQLIADNAEVINDIVVGGNLTATGADISGDTTIDGTLTSGNITAPNVVYSVVAGEGIAMSGDQDVTITNDDPGTAQLIFKNFNIDGTTIEAEDNDDTLTFEPGFGVILSSSGKTVTVAADPDELNNSGWSDGGTTVALSTSSDNVGIGTSASGYKLDVLGTTNISGATTLGSTLGVTGATTLSGGASVSSGINNNSGGITNAGSITGGTGFTSSGTITFSTLSTGVLHSNVNGVVSSSAVNLTSEVTGTLPITSGGTGLTGVLQGDIIYGSATNVFSKLSAGGDGDILQLSSGIPVWSTVAGVGSLCPNCVVDDPGGHQTITPTSTTATGLIVKQAASGSVDVFRVESNDGLTEYFKVDSSGNVTLGNQTSSGVFTVSPTSTDPISISPVAQGSNQYTGTITSEDLTTNRTWTFPDVSGIVCMASGNCTGTSASVGGSGTTNYIAKWSDTYAVGNSLLYDNGTNVGIGSTSPGAKLDIVGTLKTSGLATLLGDLSVGGHATISGSLRVDQIVDFNSTMGVSGATTLGSTLDVTGLTTIGGNLGIGSATPGYKLDLVGEFNLTDAIRVAGNAGISGYVLTSSAGGANTWTDPDSIGLWANTLNIFHPREEYASIVDLSLGGTSTASANIHLQSNGQAYFGGNVGIGSTSPTAALDVSGSEIISDELALHGASLNSAYGINVGSLAGGERGINIVSSAPASQVYGAYVNIDNPGSSGANFGLYASQTNVAGNNDFAGVYVTTDGGKAQGLYTDLTIGAGLYGYGSRHGLTGTSATLYGVSNTLTGNNSTLTGVYNSLTISETGTGYGVYNNINTTSDVTAQTGYAHYASLNTYAGASDSLYGSYIVDGGASTGGNQIGLYVDLDDADVTNYSVFVQDGSGLSYFGSNIGIGTISPSEKLEIANNGDVTIEFTDTTAAYSWQMSTSSTADDFIISAIGTGGPEFLIDTDGASYANTYATIGTNVLLHSNGNSYFNGGNVGIGSTSPIAELDITKNDGTHSSIALGASDAARGALLQKDSVSAPYDFDFYWGRHATTESGDLNFRASQDSGAYVTFQDTGNVGIGTTLPTFDLEVAARSTSDTALIAVNGGSAIVGGEVSGLRLEQGGTTKGAWRLDASGTMQFQVENAAGSNANLDFNTGASNNTIRFWPKGVKNLELDNDKAIFQSGIKVGIGGVTPTDNLHLGSGGIRLTNSELANVTDTSGVLYFDENYYDIFDFTGNGGGLAVKNEDGWGALVSTANMQYLDMDLNSLYVSNNVGIGTTAGVPLHVYGGDNLLRLDHSSATGSPYLDFRQAGTRRAYIQLADSGDDLRLNSEYGDISLYSGGTERFEIDVGGVFRLLNSSTYYFQTDTATDHIRFGQTSGDDYLAFDLDKVSMYTYGSSTPLYAQTGNFQVAGATTNTPGGRLESHVASTESIITNFRLSRDLAAESNRYFANFWRGPNVTQDNEFLFRADGYAFADQSWNGGGADVAEMYEFSDTVVPGDLVSIPVERVNNPGKELKKSLGKQYDSLVVGVISTDPGLVAGFGDAEVDTTSGVDNRRKPVALVGRVPVKVNLENGPIKAGDYLTSSSIPGQAMKSTKAGKVIGQALEDFDGSLTKSQGVLQVESDFQKKKAADIPSIPALQPGEAKIMVYVSTGWVDPSIELDLASDIEIKENIFKNFIVENVAFIKNLGVETLSINGISLSDYIANVVGLTANTYNIAATSSANLTTQQEIDLLKGLTNETASGEAKIDETILTLEENISFTDRISTFLREVVFNAKVTFMSKVEFVKQVVFKDEVKFNNDTVGRFIVPSGVTKVKVSFDTEFTQVPTVYLSAQNQVSGGYSLLSTSTDGFVVAFDQEQLINVTFDWLAVLGSRIENATIEVLDDETITTPDTPGEVAGTSIDETPTPTPNPELTPTSEPTVEPTPDITPGATTEAEAATSSAVVTE